MLSMTGRVTMLGVSRWAGPGGSYRTVQRFFGIFHEPSKVVNSLFGEARHLTQFGVANCQLGFERSRLSNLKILFFESGRFRAH